MDLKLNLTRIFSFVEIKALMHNCIYEYNIFNRKVYLRFFENLRFDCKSIINFINKLYKYLFTIIRTKI
jgi:hypothetical protein